MELVGVTLGLSVLVWVFVAIAAGLLFPIFWLWMVVDALVRQPEDYPSKETSEKVMWVLVMLLLQPAALLYFFLVWRAARTSQPVSTFSTGAAAA